MAMKLNLMAIALLFALASTDFFSEEVEQQDHYCEMVKAGSWPAYDDSIDCGKEVASAK